MAVEDIIRAVLSELRTIARTETVVGDPIEVAGATIVPVSKVSLGFGAGSGSAARSHDRDPSHGSSGGGTGGGATVEPIAFLVIRDGRVEVLTLKEKPGLADILVEELPGLLRKAREFTQRRRKSDNPGREGDALGEPPGGPGTA